MEFYLDEEPEELGSLFTDSKAFFTKATAKKEGGTKVGNFLKSKGNDLFNNAADALISKVVSGKKKTSSQPSAATQTYARPVQTYAAPVQTHATVVNRPQQYQPQIIPQLQPQYIFPNPVPNLNYQQPSKSSNNTILWILGVGLVLGIGIIAVTVSQNKKIPALGELEENQ